LEKNTQFVYERKEKGLGKREVQSQRKEGVLRNFISKTVVDEITALLKG